MKAERIICYTNYIQKGISLYKVNDFDNRGYITINKNALIRIIEDNTITESIQSDMDLEVLISYHYGKFNDEQLNCVLDKVRYIIKYNDRYKDYRGIKEIYLI